MLRFSLHSKRNQLFAWFVCGLGALFYCYEYFLRISPSVMVNDIRLAFNIEALAFGNLAAFYYYAYTPMQLPVGILMDKYGPRRLLILASLVCALGTYLFANPHNLHLAQLGRFLIGGGSAFAFVGVLKLASIWLPANRFALIAGLATSLGMIGAIAGDHLLAIVVKAEGWYATTLLSAVVGIIIAIILAVSIPEKTASQSLAASKSVQPTFNKLLKELWALFKNPYLWINGCVGCLLYLSLSAFAELWGPFYLQSTYHYSRLEAVNLVSLIFLGWAIGGPLAGWISDTISRRRLPLLIGSICTAITISIILYVPNLPKPALSCLMLLFGVFSSSQVIVFALARELSPPHLVGTALAWTNMLVMLGGMILQPLVGYLLECNWSGMIVDNLHVYTAQDFHWALAALPIGAMVAMLLMLIMKETRARISKA